MRKRLSPELVESAVSGWVMGVVVALLYAIVLWINSIREMAVWAAETHGGGTEAFYGHVLAMAVFTVVPYFVAAAVIGCFPASLLGAMTGLILEWVVSALRHRLTRLRAVGVGLVVCSTIASAIYLGTQVVLRVTDATGTVGGLAVVLLFWAGKPLVAYVGTGGGFALYLYLQRRGQGGG